MDKKITVQQLSRISLRGIVALAARAACRTVERVDPTEANRAVIEIAMQFVRDPSIAPDLFLRTRRARAPLVKGPIATAPARYAAHAVGLLVCFAADAATRDEICLDRSVEACINCAILAIGYSDAQALDAAAADYEIILDLFGEQDKIVLGEPFDPSGNGPLGAIFGV